MKRLVAGCMTGTSIDGIDAALVEIEGSGLSMSARFVRGASRPLGAVAHSLRRLARQEAMTAGEIARTASEFAQLHIEVVLSLGADALLDLICVHGQTVYHAPPLTWQLFNPAPLVYSLGAPVVFDLRSADVAAGGQGAPITPIADWVLFREFAGRLSRKTGEGALQGAAVVNLGGFVNVTVLPAGGAGSTGGVEDLAAEVERIEGGDVCVCNQLLDAIARRMFDKAFDEDGRRAAAGDVHSSALEDLFGVLRSQAGHGRSLGTGDEAGAWIDRWQRQVSGEDLAATACEAIAKTIESRIGGLPVALAGGGACNRRLRSAIESCCRGGVVMTDELGVPAAYREAACFAVLGALAQDGEAITLAQVTGRSREPRCPGTRPGCWMYP